MTPYTTEIEKQMQEMYGRLSEKDKRLYAGIEALKLPYGGVSYIAELFSCSRNTVMRGSVNWGDRKPFRENEIERPGEAASKRLKLKTTAILTKCFCQF